ncbi:MAG: hypothetical protein CM15mP95_2940 [Alphaproteobacteria bacterium]|nr:MAG: hypothetical protein CM15mP95_2940 [Alphaproteobacteria bacterium]
MSDPSQSYRTRPYDECRDDGGNSLQKGLGAIHALSHPIGAIYHTHHGTTNAVVMQAVMRFNRSEIEDWFVAVHVILASRVA